MIKKEEKKQELYNIELIRKECEKTLSNFKNKNKSIHKIENNIENDNELIKTSQNKIEELEKKLKEYKKKASDYNTQILKKQQLEQKKIIKIDINEACMKNLKINEGEIKIEVNKKYQLFKSKLSDLMKELDDNDLKKGIEKYLLNPSPLFDEIKKQCIILLNDEYNIFSNIYSKINEVYNSISTIFNKESIELLFSQKKKIKYYEFHINLMELQEI